MDFLNHFEWIPLKESSLRRAGLEKSFYHHAQHQPRPVVCVSSYQLKVRAFSHKFLPQAWVTHCTPQFRWLRWMFNLMDSSLLFCVGNSKHTNEFRTAGREVFLHRDEKQQIPTNNSSVFPPKELVWITLLFMLSGCAFLDVDSLRRKKKRWGGGKWRVSFGLIWPYFVEAVYCPEGHAVLGAGECDFFFFFPFSEGTQMHRGNTGST